MPQIFDATANENARYKRNELELNVTTKINSNLVFYSKKVTPEYYDAYFIL